MGNKPYALLLAVIAVSCSDEVDPQVCHECRIDTFVEIQDAPPENGSIMTERCDKTEEGIKELERETSGTTIYTLNDGRTMAIITEMVCTKKM